MKAHSLKKTEASISLIKQFQLYTGGLRIQGVYSQGTTNPLNFFSECNRTCYIRELGAYMIDNDR